MKKETRTSKLSNNQLLRHFLLDAIEWPTSYSFSLSGRSIVDSVSRIWSMKYEEGLKELTVYVRPYKITKEYIRWFRELEI